MSERQDNIKYIVGNEDLMDEEEHEEQHVSTTQTSFDTEPEGMHIEVKDHLETPPAEECGYCTQSFGPDMIVVEKIIHGVKWRFCSEECCQDFIRDHDFADEDLDSKDVEEPPEIEEEHDEEF